MEKHCRRSEDRQSLWGQYRQWRLLCRQMKKILLFLLLFLGLDKIGVAEKFQFKNFNNLFPSTKVYDIFKDSKGYMWFATYDGLIRYNAYEFKSFQNIPGDSTSLPINNIRALHEDASGKIWIGTWGAGTVRFNPDQETFEQVDLPAGLENHLYVNDIVEDQNNRIWIGSLDGLLIIEDTSIIAYNQGNGPDLKIRSLLVDQKNTIWVGTEGNGIYSIKDNSIQKFDLPARDEIITDIIQMKSGLITVATWDNGLYLVNPHNKDLKKIQFPSYLTGLNINGIAEGSTNELWIGTWNNGLLVYNLVMSQLQHYVNNAQDNHSITNNKVWCIFHEQDQPFWIGTHGGGLNFFDPNELKFSTYLKDLSRTDFNSNVIVRDIEEFGSHQLLIASEGAGLLLFDQSERKLVKRWTSNNGEILSDDVYAVVIDNIGDIWVGSRGGLTRIKQEDNTSLHYTLENGKLSGLQVWCLKVDQLNRIWAGTSNGLNLFDREENNFRFYFHDTTGNKLMQDNGITCFYELDNDIMFVGSKAGYRKFNPRTGKEELVNSRASDYTGLENDFIRTFYQSPDGTSYIGTHGGGIFYLKPGNTVFNKLAEDDGLSSNYIYGILADDKGKLWISTSNGLCSFDPEKKTILVYSEEDGLQNNLFSAGAYEKLQDGTLIFGGIYGFNHFDPSKVYQNNFIPPVILTDIKVMNQSVDYNTSTVLDKPVNLAEQVVLPYRKSLFSIEFASLNYVSPGKNRYLYRLEGFDEAWIDAGTRRSAFYTNVDPGTYTFTVKGSNNDDIWNQTGKSIRVVILPPYYKTWWFNLIIVLAVIGIILGLHSWRTRLLRIKKRFLQLEVNRQTVKLNNQKLEIEKKNHELSQANSLVTTHNLQLEQQKNELAQQARELQEANEKLSYATEQLKKASIQLDLDNWNLKKLVKEEKKARIVSNEVSFNEFLQIFPSEYSCMEYLSNLKWEKGYFCKKCGTKSFKNGFNAFDRRCSKCEYNESATANTILHGIRMPSPKAFYLIYITINHDGKYTLEQLSEVLKLKKSTVGKFRRKIIKRKDEYKKAFGYEVGDWENLFISIPARNPDMKISI